MLGIKPRKKSITRFLIWSLVVPFVSIWGDVKIDGSSTVFPITEAVAEEFLKVNPKLRVGIGVSGTGGGFKKLSRGEIDINNASRKIKQSEMEMMKKKNIEYIELPIAYDGIVIVVNKENNWVDHVTIDELKKIWKPKGWAQTWKDVRSTWPDKKILLYGPGTDSGTFDYFTFVVNGKERSSRSDFTRSEDDNVLVQGVAGDKWSLGYFGHIYYAENKNKIKAVPIRYEDSNRWPTVDTIGTGTYQPLSRPLFLYVRKSSLQQPDTKMFIEFYMKQVFSLALSIGHIPMPQKQYSKALEMIKNQTTYHVKSI